MSGRRWGLLPTFFFAAYLLGQAACSEPSFDNSSAATLYFSTDTLTFDTVFSTFGSTTRAFKVYNRGNKFLRIDQVRLGKADASFFRVNVNGIDASRPFVHELPPNDSLFVFVEVSIDPRNQQNPVLEIDSVLFRLNGREQDVKLTAYAQDVHLFDGQIIQSQTWGPGKPYLVLNSMLVDTLQTLRIEPGTRIFFGPRSRLYVLGSLQALGTVSDSVVFGTARTEHLYADVPGLWDGIWLLPGSVNNVLQNTHLRNAVVGIRADSLIDNGQPTLRLHNTRIEHHTAVGLLAQGSYVEATNTLFADCGIYALSLQVGGQYRFYHCTVANYWLYNNRTTPSVVVRNYYRDVLGRIQLRPIQQALFANCILYGNRENELLLDAHPDAAFQLQVENSLLRTDPKLQYHTLPQLRNCLFNQFPLFRDLAHYDYSLAPKSPAIDAGNSQIPELLPQFLLHDLKGHPRTLPPDLGAWEFQAEEGE